MTLPIPARYDFNDGNGPVPAHRHPNGGGWVADTATVASTAYVGPQAQVYGKAHVTDRAKIRGSARVYGNALVAHSAEVDDDAQVYGYAHVAGKARVCGYMHVTGNTLLLDHGSDSGATRVDIRVTDDTQASTSNTWGGCNDTGAEDGRSPSVTPSTEPVESDAASPQWVVTTWNRGRRGVPPVRIDIVEAPTQEDAAATVKDACHDFLAESDYTYVVKPYTPPKGRILRTHT